MSRERAVFWIGVIALMALGLIMGQTEAIGVAALVAACLVYLRANPPSSEA